MMPEDEIPDRRKHGFKALEIMIQKIIEEYEDEINHRFARTVRGIIIAFIIVGAASVTGLVLFSITLSDIKDNRAAFVRDSCTAQNARHDNTVHKLNDLVRQIEAKNPNIPKDQVQQSIDANLALINALAPHQDCEQLVKVSQGKAKPPPPKSSTTGKTNGNRKSSTTSSTRSSP